MLAFYAQHPWLLWFLPAELLSFNVPLYYLLLLAGLGAAIAAFNAVYSDLSDDRGALVALIVASTAVALPPIYIWWAVIRGGEAGRPRREQRSELNRYDRGFDGRDGRIDKARRVMR